MKKRFIITLSIIMALILMPSLVNAEESHYNINTNQNTYANTNVTVGNVAGSTGTVYSVDIEWGDLSFDWTYNSSTSQYEWSNESKEVCEPAELSEGSFVSSNSSYVYYQNSNCTTRFIGEVHAGQTIYQKANKAHSIKIYDYSKNGYVKPSLSWRSAVKYDYTTATFKYEANRCQVIPAATLQQYINNYSGYTVFTDSTCSSNSMYVTSSTYNSSTTYYGDPGLGSVYKTYSGGALPSVARLWLAGSDDAPDYNEGSMFNIELQLGVDRTKTVNMPNPGETIGYVTILLTPRNNYY